MPLVGDFRARQIGVPLGSALILLVAWLTIRRIGARTSKQLLAVGVSWLVLMLTAETLLGRWLFGYPWSRIGEDFDPRRGGLLALGMLVLALAPLLADRWRE